MFKKLCSVIIAIFVVSITSLSAFALDFNYDSNDEKLIQLAVDYGLPDIFNRLKSKDFSNILTYYTKNYVAFAYIDDVNSLKCRMHHSGKYHQFVINTDNKIDYVRFLYDGSILQGNGINTVISSVAVNFSDNEIVNLLNTQPDFRRYVVSNNKFVLNINDDFVNAVLDKAFPTYMRDGVIGSCCFDGFIDNLIKDINIIIPVVIGVFSFLLCIYTTIKSLRYYLRG